MTILIAMDEVILWRTDPTKHSQSEVHNLMVLIERADDTNARHNARQYCNIL